MKPAPTVLFGESLDEAVQLQTIHRQLTGTAPGRRHNVEVLNRSTVVFVCAAFEAFIENLATEAFNHFVAEANDHSGLPVALRRVIAEALKNDKNELKVWDLAGEGWKAVAERHKNGLIAKHVGPFNTPKPHNIDALMKDLLGMPQMSSAWHWRGKGGKHAEATAKLKAFVELRGALAHGAKPRPKVTLREATDYVRLLARISICSSNSVRKFCHSETGKYPWPEVPMLKT